MGLQARHCVIHARGNSKRILERRRVARRAAARLQSSHHFRTRIGIDVTTTCPWCSAPRDTGPDCPRCGANYAKAEAIKTHGRAAVDTPPAAAEPPDPALSIYADDPMAGLPAVADPRLEYKFCIAAIPAMLFIAIVFHASGLGASLQRIFLTMPVHEFGHAVTAWFCGYTAIPTLWKTLVPETRGFIAPLALAGALGYGLYRAWQVGNRPLLGIAGVLLLLQVICTFGIKADTARMLITFGGDGMGMILATLLMASFFFGKNTQLYKGSLRWGFVAIGAASFVDIYATWWRARKDQSAIPYGTMDGMASDSMTLVDVYRWSFDTLVSRYVTLGVCCLIALALVYAWGVRRAKVEMETRRLAEKTAEWAQRTLT
jgi:hypothetical protein